MSITIEGVLTNVKDKSFVLTWKENDIVVAAPVKGDAKQLWKVVVGVDGQLQGPIQNVGSNFYIGWGAEDDDVTGNVVVNTYKWQLKGSDLPNGLLHFQFTNTTNTFTLVANVTKKSVELAKGTTVPEEGKWTLSRPT